MLLYVQHDGCSDDDVIGRYEGSPEVLFMLILSLTEPHEMLPYVSMTTAPKFCHW
jgi:hypothetical protein